LKVEQIWVYEDGSGWTAVQGRRPVGVDVSGEISGHGNSVAEALKDFAENLEYVCVFCGWKKEDVGFSFGNFYKRFSPLSETMEFEIEESRRWGEERCKSASGKFIPAKKEAKEG
jgi:hypothetical protein